MEAAVTFKVWDVPPWFLTIILGFQVRNHAPCAQQPARVHHNMSLRSPTGMQSALGQ